jgi:hypothetical protein
MSENFLKSLYGCIELHKLIVAGKGDHPEADDLRDILDAPWYAMTENERNAIRQISAALYLSHEPDEEV